MAFPRQDLLRERDDKERRRDNQPVINRLTLSLGIYVYFPEIFFTIDNMISHLFERTNIQIQT
jgi:hypothetical protein